jgi:hypothetical protein
VRGNQDGNWWEWGARFLGAKGAGFDADMGVPQHLWDAPYGLWNCLLAWFAMGELESWWGIFLDFGEEQGGRRTSMVMGGGMEVCFGALSGSRSIGFSPAS